MQFSDEDELITILTKAASERSLDFYPFRTIFFYLARIPHFHKHSYARTHLHKRSYKNLMEI